MGSPGLEAGPEEAGGHAITGGLGTVGLLFDDETTPEGI